MASKEDVYGAFIDYFGDIAMRQIKDDGKWVVYGSKSYSGLSQHRYLFVIVPKRVAPGPETTLNQLDWISLQTRTTDDIHDVPTHQLFLDENKKQVLSDIINVIDRTQNETSYITDSLPIRIQLIHDRKKNNFLQYPDKARLYQAINTFNCVIEIL